MDERYSRQERFEGIGREGQERICRSCVTIVGCGALGSTSASLLVRAGVGTVRIIDRDFVELHNLHRQGLFDEEDVLQALPKAAAAARKLERCNSLVKVEGIVADFVSDNAMRLIAGSDVVVDAFDNFEARLLLNDACLSSGIPWVYGGAIGAQGTTLVVTPGEGPCFRCLVNDVPSTVLPTCETLGVVGPAPALVASIQAADALRMLVAGPKAARRGILSFDVWSGDFQRAEVQRRADCPACAGRYDFLLGRGQGAASVMCGGNAVQVRPAGTRAVSLEQLERVLAGLGTVQRNEFLLRFAADGLEFVVFPDGRAVVRNTRDESVARSFYAKYIGT